MIIVHNFNTEFNRKSNEFRIISLEVPRCPICGKILSPYGVRNRIVINGVGNVFSFIIRRLWCSNCHRIHHELPSILIPYKRYTCAAIQSVIDASFQHTNIGVIADDKTIRNWITWFRELSSYFKSCLISLKEQYCIDNLISILPFSHLNKPKKWLSFLVRSITNSNMWISTRSSLCVQSI